MERLAKATPSKSMQIESRDIIQGDLRLDASFYASDAAAARKVLEKSGYELRPLSGLVAEGGLFNLTRFRRIWVEGPDLGFPYITASEILLFKQQRVRYISKKKTENPEKFFVKEGWLLVTCSGTVGIPLYVTATLTKFFQSHDLIRIIAKDPNDAGYLYAYLASSIAKPLVTKDQYGGVVDHIEPAHIATLPVPMLEPSTRRRIGDKIVEAWRLREEANRLETEAISELEDAVKKGR
jgi:type I restriction enzyme S subunit